jgi:predicted AlkP superfamily pyrophosphatase or phosphodiesterase
MIRTLLALTLLSAAPVSANPPRLALFITVDALGSDTLLRQYRSLKGGLGQAIAGGAFFPSVRFQFAQPGTAAGHATLATGANPWRHGVVSNRIWNRETGRFEPILLDSDHPVLEAPPSLDDVSPQNLMAETLADSLRLSTRLRGKAIAISGKGRASIPMAGRLGQAWWFNETIGKFVTGTWYAKEVARWAKALNEKGVADGALGRTWTLSLPEKSYFGDDDRPWESDYLGLGRAFPHPIGAGMSSPGPTFYAAFASTPLIGDLLVQMARAAIDGEQLGRDEDPDLLMVSFSWFDHVYHLYGPYSWEMQDALVKLDRQISDLISAAERAAGGRQNLLVVITADHGGAAIPEEWTAAGLSARRVNPVTIQQGLITELRRKFKADLVLGMDESDLYLDSRAIAERSLDGPAVRRAAALWLQAQPGVAVALARDDLFANAEHAGYARALRLGYFPERSGDVVYTLSEHSVFTEERTGTGHGAPYAYDTIVPLVLVGKGVRPGVYRSEISATDVAPTVAAALEIPMPAKCEGTARGEAFGGR